MSTRFPVVSVAKSYVERHDEYLGYLDRKSDEGLRNHAQVTIGRHGLPPLVGNVDRAELLQIITGAAFPHYAEAVQVLTGTGASDA